MATLCHAQGISLSDWLDRSFQAYPQKLVNVRVMDRLRRKNWSATLLSPTPLLQRSSRWARPVAFWCGPVVRSPCLRVMVEAEQSDAVEHLTGHLAAVAEEHLNVA